MGRDRKRSGYIREIVEVGLELRGEADAEVLRY